MGILGRSVWGPAVRTGVAVGLALAAQGAAAACEPAEVMEAGTTITCTGIETEPVSNDGFGNVTVDIRNGAVVQGVNSPVIILDGAGQRVLNDGLITGINVVAGAAIFGIGGQVVNSGIVDITDGIGFWLEGPSSLVTNNGSIRMDGFGSEGVFVEGSNGRIFNNGSVTMNGNQSEALTTDGILSGIINDGSVTVIGDAATGLAVDGAQSAVANLGLVSMAGRATLGMGGAGLSVGVQNLGQVIMTGDGGFAMGALGEDLSLDNSGTIVTNGTFSLGVVASGLASTLPGLPNVVNGGGASITTNGAESAAMVLGLDELIIPVGVSVPVPLSVLQPAQGHMANFGEILTLGTRSDGMQGFANDSLLSNAGSIVVRGDGARGMFVNGTDNEILNIDNIVAGSESSQNSVGIGFDGGTVAVTNSGDIDAAGQNAAGIRGSTGATATVVNESDISVLGPAGQGIAVTGVGVDAEVNVNNASGATVTVEGDDGVGLRGVGRQVVVQNGAVVSVSGDGSTGVEADLVTFANVALLENTASVDATGAGASGMRIRSLVDDEGIQVGNQRATISDAGCAGSSAVMVNCGVVNVSGDQAAAMRLEGDGLAAENQATLNMGSAGAAGIVSAGRRNVIENSGLIQGQDGDGNAVIVNGARGIDFSGADNEVVNAGSIAFEAGEGSAIAGTQADNAEVFNRGSIALTGAGAAGVRLEGDNAAVVNAGTSGEDTSQIFVGGSGAKGVAVTGAGAFVANVADGDIANPEMIVSGANARGIDVAATASGAYLVENAGTMNVSGADSVGVMLRNASDAVLSPLTRNTAQNSQCLGAGQAAGLLNCGTLIVAEDRAVGMAALGVQGVYVENSGLIRASGDGVTGLLIAETPEGIASTGNLVLSLDDIAVDGTGATGVEISGTGNRFVHGQGALSIPEEDAILPDTFTIISVQLQRDSNLQDNPLLPVAAISAQGAGSVGISVSGNDNFVALMNVDQLDGVAQPAAVIASGTGSVGVAMSGNGNRLLNQGLIEGETGIQGGEGTDLVQNLGTLIGGANLAGGDDTFAMAARYPSGPVLAGIVDGGLGSDILEVTAYNLVATQTSDAFINGDQFVNFEEFLLTVAPSNPVGGDNAIVGNNLVTLNGTLSVVDLARLGDSSTLRLGDEALLSADLVRLESGSVLTGNGSVGRTPQGPGVVTPSVQILEGAQVLAGDSPGQITFLSDVEFAGFMEIEVAGLADGLFDLITVEGDLTLLGGEIRFEFIDGFVPAVGDTFDFLDVAGSIFGLDSVAFSVGGFLDDLTFDISPLGGGLSFATVLRDSGPTDVPEPDTLMLLGIGWLALWASRRRQHRPRLRSD